MTVMMIRYTVFALIVCILFIIDTFKVAYCKLFYTVYSHMHLYYYGNRDYILLLLYVHFCGIIPGHCTAH